jgi:outer membrane protein assembly factor BamA
MSTANVAHAQETRAESLRQTRIAKQAKLEPYKASALETALRTIETEGLLIFRDGLYPKIGSLTTGSGFAWGGGYRNRRLFGDEAVLDVWAGASMSRYWAMEGRLRFPMLANGRLMVESYARRHEYPREDYFGLGPDSLRSNQTDYMLLNNTFGARGGVRPTSVVTLGGGVEYLQPRIGNGRDDDLPSIGTVFDDQTAPGLSHQSDVVRTLAFVDVDWRRPLNARKGGWYRLELSHFADSGEANTFDRVDADVRQYVSFLSERRVLFGRAVVSTSDAAAGQEMPFYFMPTLGGHDSLRGYRAYRFRAPHALLLQGEYRFEIWSGLDGALFYDAGKVAMRRADLNFRDLESDYGFGFRFNTDNGIVLRVDAAFGSRDGRHLWIVFGGTF